MQRGTLLYPVHGCSIKLYINANIDHNCPQNAITNPLSIISLISVFVSIKRNTVPHKLCRNYNTYIIDITDILSTHKQKYSHLKVHTEVSIYVLSDCLYMLYIILSPSELSIVILFKKEKDT